MHERGFALPPEIWPSPRAFLARVPHLAWILPHLFLLATQSPTPPYTAAAATTSIPAAAIPRHRLYLLALPPGCGCAHTGALLSSSTNAAAGPTPPPTAPPLMCLVELASARLPAPAFAFSRPDACALGPHDAAAAAVLVHSRDGAVLRATVTLHAATAAAADNGDRVPGGNVAGVRARLRVAPLPFVLRPPCPTVLPLSALPKSLLRRVRRTQAGGTNQADDVDGSDDGRDDSDMSEFDGSDAEEAAASQPSVFALSLAGALTHNGLLVRAGIRDALLHSSAGGVGAPALLRPTGHGHAAYKGRGSGPRRVREAEQTVLAVTVTNQMLFVPAAGAPRRGLVPGRWL